MAVAPNQHPIIAPLYLGGATLDTNDMPMGERRSSANVSTRYVPMRRLGLTSVSPWPSTGAVPNPMEPMHMIRNATAATIIPYPILRGADGSFLRFARNANIATENGVRATT